MEIRRIAVLAALLYGAFACGPTGAVQVNGGGLTRLAGNTSRNARAELDRGPVSDSLPMDHILMMLRRTASQEQQLEQIIDHQYDPHSADFHKWLTPQQFGERFGPTTADAQKVTQWLTQHGFKVNRVPAGGLFVDFSGTAGQVTEAFHTQIHRFRVGEQDHYANSADPYVPTELASLVSGFRSLNDFYPQSHARHLGTAHLDRSTGKWRSHLTASANSLYIAGPQDFATIYGVKQVWQQGITGAGQTIAVVGESNIDSADIQSFRDQFGITALGPNGAVEMENPPSTVCNAPSASDNEPESYLDAEWSGAMAPNATIDFVACGSLGVTSGADLAAAYVVGDASHVQRVSVLSTSYGDCEALPQSEANQFYVSLWQQAAAEGITVVVAAGDTGGDGCQDVATDGTDGLTVVNEASTPYNVAAGGTDFSDVFSGTTSTYWSATNGADWLSAQSYIPEMAWNESCGSPLVLAAFGQGYTSSSGPSGFCTHASQQPVDPETGYSPYFLPWAGSGGLSVVSARPTWQRGVMGIPSQGGRAVPDISMFASGGYTWGQTLILCDSALANMPAGTACDFSNPNDVYANYAGGTSFVAPAFAGIMALIDQHSGDRQGQANYVLYPLAGEQYVSYGGATQPNLANCAAYLGPQTLGSCYFHDVSATPNVVASPAFITGNTSIPCTGTATAAGTYSDSSTDSASNIENCYGYQITVGTNLGITPAYYGVLSTAQNAASPAFAAAPGYDLATGLGSPNVATLVNAPQWAGGGLATSIQLSFDNAKISPAESVTLQATVTDQDNLPVLGGTVTFYSGNSVIGTVNEACSPGGAFSLEITGATLGTVGNYPDVFAVYGGGGQQCQQSKAAYYGSQSAPVTVSVRPERLGSDPTLLKPSVPHPFGLSR